eukprot:11548830-Ditylum_brightwellii.AAC.1
MQLHEEALLQYEELEAFVPDSIWAEEDEEEEVQWGETRKKSTPTKVETRRELSSSDLAAA